MQIVIDITEEDCKKIFNTVVTVSEMDNSLKGRVYTSVVNGILLPKGHGRLIILSEDAVKKEQVSVSFSSQKWISEVDLSNATVATIEADKESLQNE